MQNQNKHKWMSSGYMRGSPTGEIDYEKGIIEGVTVITVGEAKGHGFFVDSEFVQTVSKLGGSRRHGLKARFGHPNMCSTALGTFIGRFKNFRQGETERDGEKAQATIADLYLSNGAKDTPHGNLYDYVLTMAKEAPDMFGTSIVFTPGREYKLDARGEKVFNFAYEHEPNSELSEEVYVECKEIHACDAVDDPATNDGLFSRFSQETIAGQVTEFLDLHPQVWAALKENPAIIEALGRHSDNVDEFITRYNEYRKNNTEEEAMSEKIDNSEQLKEAEEEVVEVVETEAEEVEGSEEPETVEENTGEEVVETEELSRNEFIRIADEFGSDIATQAMRDGGSYESALKLAYDAEVSKRQKLEKQINESEKNGTPVKVTEAKEKKTLFKTGK